MAKFDVAAATVKLHALLKDASSSERQAVVAATLTLLGETSVPVTPTPGPGHQAGPNPAPASGVQGGIRQFFDAKQPESKIEQLAVAAKFRESQGATSSSREDFKAAFDSARRPFDGNNFHRDISNAKSAKFFNPNKDNVLSYYGEQYVDALPDRTAAAAIRKPGKVRKKPGKKRQ